MRENGSKKRITVFVLTVILLIAVSAATVYAYLRTSIGTVENSFDAAADPQPTIEETFDDKVKTDVAVNVGDPGYSVYVRAAIVVTWEDANGVLATPPVKDTDYEITLNKDDWFEKDGFYYLKKPIISGKTAVLIEELRELKDASKDGYKLHVEIISQTIQALGSTDDGGTPAVTDAWGVSVDSSGDLTE
ncbi:MAG: hypothetical protein IJD82_00800 [Clostridia bacterium]|nr:hypothetical protein [Clostridia bacterium]